MDGSRLVKAWQNFQGRIASALENFAELGYKRALKVVLDYRYAAWAAATGVICVVLALLLSGRVVFQFMPSIEGDRIWSTLTMPAGVPASLTQEAIGVIEAKAIELAAELDIELNELKAAGDLSLIHI